MCFERERETKQRGASHAPLKTKERVLIKINKKQCRHEPEQWIEELARERTLHCTPFASTTQGSAIFGVGWRGETWF
ncbi:unnamed protein product [Ixodes persulcatus]